MKNSSGAEDAGLSRLPDRLRRARRLATMSQAALAHAVGISASAVAQWEQQEGTHPGLVHLIAFARVTGVSVDWLVTGAGRPRRSATAEEPAALTADAYARDAAEEALLRDFRLLAPRGRRVVFDVIEELARAKARRR